MTLTLQELSTPIKLCALSQVRLRVAGAPGLIVLPILIRILGQRHLPRVFQVVQPLQSSKEKAKKKSIWKVPVPARNSVDTLPGLVTSKRT